MNTSELKNIKMLLIDCDGVLTDGRLWLDSNNEWKRFFYVPDGVGLKLLMKNGYKVGMITGGKSHDVKTRAEFLKLNYFKEGAEDKLIPYKEILNDSKISSSEICYIGDEVFDIPILDSCAFGVTVPHATEIVKKSAKYITKQSGGAGAVREICDALLDYGFFRGTNGDKK